MASEGLRLDSTAWFAGLSTIDDFADDDAVSTIHDFADDDAVLHQSSKADLRDSSNSKVLSMPTTSSKAGGWPDGTARYAGRSNVFASSSDETVVERSSKADIRGIFDSKVLSVPTNSSTPFVQRRCAALGCGKLITTPSQLRKHQNRHKGVHLCQVRGCPRSEQGHGFGTVNDRDRHHSSVHKDKGFSAERYSRCFADGCSRGGKTWDRFDNFKTHVEKIHAGIRSKEQKNTPEKRAIADALILRSQEWWNLQKQQGQAPTSVNPEMLHPHDDSIQLTDSSVTHHSGDLSLPARRTLMAGVTSPRAEMDAWRRTLFPRQPVQGLQQQHPYVSHDNIPLQASSLQPSLAPKSSSETNGPTSTRAVTHIASSPTSNVSDLSSNTESCIPSDFDSNDDFQIAELRASGVIDTSTRRIVDSWISGHGPSAYLPISPSFRRRTNIEDLSSPFVGHDSQLTVASIRGSSNSKRQRKIPNDDSDEDQPGDRPPKRPRERRSQEPPNPELAIRQLRCPYNAFDPMRFSAQNLDEKKYRICSCGIWHTIKTLMQHLRRVHQRPKCYCGRCFEIFKTRNLLDAHSRRPARCSLSSSPFIHQMSDEQLAAAQAVSENKSGEGTEEKWYKIFTVLFPESVRPDSPYYNYGANPNLEAFLGFFRRTAPRTIANLLTLRGFSLDDVEQLATELVLEQATPEIISGFRAEQGPYLPILRTSPDNEKPAGQDEKAEIPRPQAHRAWQPRPSRPTDHRPAQYQNEYSFSESEELYERTVNSTTPDARPIFRPQQNFFTALPATLREANGLEPFLDPQSQTSNFFSPFFSTPDLNQDLAF